MFTAYLLQLSTPIVTSQVFGFRTDYHPAREVTGVLLSLAQQALIILRHWGWGSYTEDNSCMGTRWSLNCGVATAGHKAESCEAPVLKLQLRGNSNLQLEPRKPPGSHSRQVFMLFFFLKTSTAVGKAENPNSSQRYSVFSQHHHQ